MKLIYKTTIPTLVLLLALVIFVSVYSRMAVEEAILFKEMERMAKTAQNALLPEAHHEEGEESEEDVHLESEEAAHSEEGELGHEEEEAGDFHAEELAHNEELILNPIDFNYPTEPESQAHFTRYLQEFKDPEIKSVTLWSKDLKILSTTDEGGHDQDQSEYLNKILNGAEPFFIKTVSSEGAVEKNCIDIFTTVELEGKTYGIVVIRLDTDAILAPIKGHLNNIMIISILAGMLTLIAIYFVNHYYISRSMLLARNKEEFFAIASHEMRTPLSAIKGATSIILNYFPQKKMTENEMLDFVKQAHDSCVRLIQIANDYIDTLRIEQHGSLFSLQSMDLVEVIDLVIKEITEVAKEKGLTLTFEKPTGTDKYMVNADKERSKQIVYNLIANAINYTKQGGVTVKIQKEEKFVTVTVTDTGIGISKENQELLFKKFQQAGKSVMTREISLSVGMGLYICKLLVENMKGKIGLIKSEVDKGSEFYFSLPKADN